MFDERIAVNQLLECLDRDKVILDTVRLIRARLACRICDFGDQTLLGLRLSLYRRETLNPNLSGYSAKRRWTRVLLPTPEGPERTSGRRKAATDMEGEKEE